jgi:cbb3-type cytochrome oxidase subunit 3
VVFGGVLFLLVIACWVWALVECAITPGEACRNLPKIVWVLLIVLFGVFGAAGWFVFGRPRRTSGAARPARSRPSPRQESLVAPAPSSDSGPMSDRRSAELDRELEAWEAEQARRRADTGGSTPGELGATGDRSES